LLRGALFALGGFCILASLSIAAFRLIGPDGFYGNVIAMGFGFGIPLIILGFLTGIASRHPSLRVLLEIALAAGGFIVVGFMLIGLAGDQRTPLGGVGFFAVLIGMIALPIAFISSILAAIVVDTMDRNDKHNRARTAVSHKIP
jgi:ABC-type transport system involved in multi-copper enzyme maturation permease subunit